MSRVTITVDSREMEAEAGKNLLFALLDGGIYIPNLCAMRGVEPPHGGCRLCYVEVEGMDGPVTSCTCTVEEGMVLHTRTEAVDRLMRAAFEMLLSCHRLECKRCPKNGRCELQTIAKARKLPLKGKGLPKLEPDFPVDESRPDMGLNPNRCVLCGKCVYVCNHKIEKGIITFAQRGLSTVLSTFDGQPLAEQDCNGCTRCAEVCPVGAIYLRDG